MTNQVVIDPVEQDETNNDISYAFRVLAETVMDPSDTVVVDTDKIRSCLELMLSLLAVYEGRDIDAMEEMSFDRPTAAAGYQSQTLH